MVAYPRVINDVGTLIKPDRCAEVYGEPANIISLLEHYGLIAAIKIIRTPNVPGVGFRYCFHNL